MSNEPDSAIAGAMAAEFLDERASVTRFATGMRHYVFEAVSGQGLAVVVRISRREDINVVRNSLYWSDRLRSLGIPMPQVLHVDLTMTRHSFPFVILERLPGRDLSFIIERLTDNQLRKLARRLAGFQAKVASLGPSCGYGFAPRIEGPFLHSSWVNVVSASIMRSRHRICSAGIVAEEQVDRVEAAAAGLTDYFAEVRPTPFLHDITTKNVIIDNGHLSGIVDVDDLCFGDPLLLVGLIRVALLANRHKVTYADAWVDVLHPNETQRVALDFYTAMFCIDFMGELGHSFNRTEPAPVKPAYVERLQGLLDRYLAALDSAT